MADRVIALSGPISCGKSTLAGALHSSFKMQIFKTREVLRETVKPHQNENRKALQLAGEHLDKSTSGAWVVKHLEYWLQNCPDAVDVVIDSARIRGQVDALRKAFGPKVIHVHLTAPLVELEKRYNKRQKQSKKSTLTYEKARDDPTEQQVESLRDIADIVIDTNRCTTKDVLVRVVSHLNLRLGKGVGYVDVIVGGQYGSEGKGNIVSYLSTEYDLLVRVGGPNAGHKVFEEPHPYTHHQLPSGTRRCQANLLIGPGATLSVDGLQKEIAECNVEAGRLFIDPQAMIISDADIKKEKKGVSAIGSTGQGGGAAMARRIIGRFDKPHPLLAKDIKEFQPYIRSATEVLDKACLDGDRILLEGTQGTGLSLYHGSYPHVTSRDTSVSGCLAETGIPWSRVRRAIMVCRTYPIRVESPRSGTSGPMSQETSWLEISKRSGLNYSELLKTEKTSTTHKKRRVGEFEWDLLRKSALINGATDIALTFADYLSKKNQQATRFDQLDKDTINFIQEVERVARASVSLISTGFSHRSIIDRRRW